MNILVFGASGMIGHQIWRELKASIRAQYYAVTRKNKERLDKYNLFDSNDHIVNLDIAYWDNVEKTLYKIMPDWIINAAGITLRKEEINNLERTLEINALFPKRLEKWCEQNDKHIIHISTDCVFGGESEIYSENSIPSAKDFYGKSKYLGEVSGPNALTLRFSCIGRELEEKTELLEWFLAQEGKEIRGFSKVLYSGVTNQIIGKEIVKIIKCYPTLNGLFQISAPPISKYDLLLLLKKHSKMSLCINEDSVPVSRKILSSQKYSEATGYEMQSWDAMVANLFK